MHKTEIQQSFDYLVSKFIWPHFKLRGYKKSGNNFRFFDESGWGKIFKFQKSIYFNKNFIKFTINTGLYLSEAEEFHCKLQSGEKFQESICMVRQRIGYLSDAKTDLWFELDDDTEKIALYKQVEEDVSRYVIPYFDSINSRKDILKFFENGYKSMYAAAQIHTLFFNGYKELAKKQLEDAFNRTDNKHFLETLNGIKQQFDA